MVSIEVLGPGCANCKRLEQNAREAVAMAGVEAEIVKVADYREIAARGVMRTPGLVIDGKVVSAGGCPPPVTSRCGCTEAGSMPRAAPSPHGRTQTRPTCWYRTVTMQRTESMDASRIPAASPVVAAGQGRPGGR